MAVGDAFTAQLGTGTVNRQPASGVVEQITHMVKKGTADAINMYDGTNTLAIYTAAVVTYDDIVSSDQVGADPYNLALMITNGVYLRKTGTTDLVWVGGVQTEV